MAEIQISPKELYGLYKSLDEDEVTVFNFVMDNEGFPIPDGTVTIRGTIYRPIY